MSIDPHPVSVDTMDLLPDVNVEPEPEPAPASPAPPEPASPAPPDPLGAARGAVAPVQRAAGAVVWRRHKGRLLVALVHRPRYDDWSWPKGKLDDGEDWPVAAAREVREETGLRVRLGQVLPPTSYPVLGPDGLKAVKEVRYWSAVVTGGDGRLEHEVDKVAWLTPQKALRRLTYEHDRRQLAALMVADEEHRLRTWPLLVVRHAKAIPRKQWSKADWRRPLDERGARQSEAMVALLRAYDVQRVITSSATRCILTVAPYAKATKAKIHSSAVFSEEGFEEHPLTAGKAFAHALGRGSATALCSHGPLLPHLLNDLAMLADPTLPKVQADLEEAARENLDKGEVLVAHLAGSRKQVRVVGVERHPPLR